MRTRSLLMALLAMLAVSVAYPPQSRAAASAAAASERLVVSPRAGQVVRSHHAWLRVRSPALTDTLRVRLNGTRIGDEFGAPRRGMRTVRASLSHGLRRGGNVLRVTVRSRGGAVRTSTVRFVLDTPRHLVGAGRDRELAVDGEARIRGAVKARPGGAGAKLRWTVLRAPRRSPAHDALLGGAAPHTLTSSDGEVAGFRPRVPGRYTLQLSAGGGSGAASDTMDVEVTPRSSLVPIETMATMDVAHGDQRGIRVGDATYRLRAARGFESVEKSVLQVLVLERDTLGFVSNTIYTDLGRLGDDLGKLYATSLVIVVAQPNSPFCCPSFNFDGVLGRIGVAETGAVLLAGEMSAIGVPGMRPGEADVNATRKKGDPIDGAIHIRPAPMKGYLTPDQWGNYGFVPRERVPFAFGPKKPPTSCTPETNGGRGCIDSVGFRLRHLDARTLAPAAHDGQFYAMHQAGPPEQLAADLEAMPEDDVVMIEAVGSRPAGQDHFPPMGVLERATMVRLANAIAQVGGTRDAFNRIARRPASDANGGMTYALVGWKGAGEGAGAEVAAGVDGEGDAPSLEVVLRPDRESLFRPVEGDSAPEALTNLILKEPTTKWPLDDEPGAKAALSWLGSTQEKLSTDPRADYRSQAFGQSTWNGLAAEIEKVAYSAVPAETRDDFTGADFRKARDQLVKELKSVGSVRAYLSDLASPISDSQVLSYATVQAIGAKVHEEAQPPDEEGTMRWVELSKILLELAGPFTHHVSSAIAGLMELGTFMFGANESGGPVEEIPFKASEFGKDLTDQMQESIVMYRRAGDVIVSDPEKLSFVAKYGGCSGNSTTCPPGWSFTDEDVTQLTSDIQRTVERAAYEELLPLGFRVYGLNPQRLDRAPDPRWYNCGTHPFWYFSADAVSLGTTPLLQELDPQDAAGSLWKLLVLAKPGGSEAYFYAEPPSDETLQRVFGPVSRSTSPKDGGLGVSLARLLPEDEWDLWAPTPPFRPTHDACS